MQNERNMKKETKKKSSEKISSNDRTRKIRMMKLRMRIKMRTKEGGGRGQVTRCGHR